MGQIEPGLDTFHEFRVFVGQTMNDEPEKSRHPKVTAVLFQVGREDGKLRFAVISGS